MDKSTYILLIIVWILMTVAVAINPNIPPIAKVAIILFYMTMGYVSVRGAYGNIKNRNK